ncbi:MAG: hypothetical protein EOM83_01405 [Clostridia bacterium]|nr:hypothetical protein [Clostridia bacterium]
MQHTSIAQPSSEVTLNPAQCEKIAAIVSVMKPSAAFYQRPYLQGAGNRETRFRMHFFAVAICHQTYHLHHKGKNLFGWDFIEDIFLQLAADDSSLLQPHWLASASLDKIIALLSAAFAEGSDCSLDRLPERAHLMQQAAEILNLYFSGSVQTLFDFSANQLINEDETGLYQLLPRCEAFADPQQKKTTFLVKLLEDAGLIKIADRENFIPIMDYHMQRVLLRTGCVEIADVKLRHQILHQQSLPTDEPIRGLCIEAMRRIAIHSQQSITRMNDIFWALGRSCCHQILLCRDRHCEKSPCTLTQIYAIENHSQCVFQKVCKGAVDAEYQNLWEPRVETHFY